MNKILSRTGVLIGMLACTALVGCSDDDVLNNAEKENQQTEKMQAYMTFSIASATNSSRGVNEGTTTGDVDGDEESSGHTNAGTAKENNVKQVMIVYYNEDAQSNEGDGLVATYSLPTGDIKKTGITYNADGTYSPDEPYELKGIGTYKVLIVLNPNEDLKTRSATNSSTAKTIYDYILGNESNSLDDVSDVIGASMDEFMMTNKSVITIEVTPEHNSKDNAAKPLDNDGREEIIEVERVASKITFRPTTMPNFTAVGELKNGVNVYGIDYTPYTYSYARSNYWVKNSDGTYNYLIGLYPAITADSNKDNILVFINDDKTRTYYELDPVNTTPHVGKVDGFNEPQSAPIVIAYKTNEGKAYTGVPVYKGGTATAGTPLTYYVKLNKYILTNLNNKINYVRHTGTNATDVISVENAFGTVSSSTYLLDPNTAEKSQNVTTTTDNVLGFASGYDGSKWFGNTAFKTITSQIENGNATLTNLPGSNNDNNQYKTDEDGNIGTEGIVDGEPTSESNYVGSILSYCLENSVKANNQNPLLTTGIIFEAQIYDNEGNVVPLMYHVKHGGEDQFYSNLAALVEETGGAENSPWFAYTDEEYNLESLKDVTKLNALKNAGINVYKDGKCYYFSSQIKHFDYGTGEKGVMEYAIMRNNIYSLEVSSVDGFGFSSLDLESGILESETELEKVYLTMKAKILPWIVRFNNITF